jgi:hypothetical protein
MVLVAPIAPESQVLEAPRLNGSGSGFRAGILVQESTMKRWWPRSPWRGIRWRERRRLDKLSRRGQRVEDPQDGQRVQDWIAYWDEFYGTLGGKALFVGLWIFTPWYAIGVIVRVAQGNMGRAVWDALVLVLFSLLLLQVRRRRRDLRRTALANDWGG